MDGKSIREWVIRHFFPIYSMSIFVTWIFCRVSDPPVQMIDVNLLAQMALFALSADLCLVAYYSRQELSEQQWIVRHLMHLILLEVVCCIWAHVLDLARGAAGYACFIISVLLVDLFMRGYSWLMQSYEAKIINMQIERNRAASLWHIKPYSAKQIAVESPDLPESFSDPADPTSE